MDDEGLCRVGWSTANASLNLGTDEGGFGYGGTGKKSNKGSFDSYGETFGLNDVIGTIIDWPSRTISFSKNGVDLGVGFTISSRITGPLFPAVVLKNAQISFNFGGCAIPLSFCPSAVAAVGKARSEDCVDNTTVSSPTIAVTEQLSDIPSPMALILEPARELADQAYQALNIFKVGKLSCLVLLIYILTHLFNSVTSTVQESIQD